MKLDTILVLDFGGQYCHLIARRVREHNVYSEIVPCDVTQKEIKAINKRVNVKGFILSGGPSSVYTENAPKILHIFSENDIFIYVSYKIYHLVGFYGKFFEQDCCADY